MRAARANTRERIERLLDDAERTLAVLRAELLPDDREMADEGDDTAP